MLSRDRRWIIVAGAAVLLLLGLTQLRPAAVQAQCGTQASSCKTCHEVQAQDAVNSKGAWHTDHAFGDFCEFCHAGNVQATDKTAAHQGLVSWNADLKASCATCHAADYEQRAGGYAKTLGVSLNTGPAPAAGGAAAAGSAAAGSGTAATTTSAAAACAPQGGEEVDYNLLYAQQLARPPLVSNWGNVILALMSLGVGMVFIGTVWTWEGWGRKVGAWIRNNVTPVSDAIVDVSKRAETSAPEAQSADASAVDTSAVDTSTAASSDSEPKL
jgi:hypothetical protein